MTQPNIRRRIVHVDMDAFFASVEQRDRPELRGKPVVVGADPQGGRGRGVVSAASYEARRFGIHSALPISQAYRACPTAIFLPPRFEAYSEASTQIMEVLGGFSPLVEPVSIDEAFLDCSGTDELFGTDQQLGAAIKAAITAATDLNCSVGIAPNKFIAKVASDLNKPNGLAICAPGKEQEFLAPLPVKALWGAGPKTVAKLASLGCVTVADVARLPESTLVNKLGQQGSHLHRISRGMDARAVQPGHQRKSISEERTFGDDSDNPDQLRQVLLAISDHLARRMRALRIRGRTMHFKIRLEGFETFVRSRTVPEPISARTALFEFATAELAAFNRRGKRVRLLGIGVSNLSEPPATEQMSLFRSSSDEADTVLDGLKERFGTKLSRASLLGQPERSSLEFGTSEAKSTSQRKKPP